MTKPNKESPTRKKTIALIVLILLVGWFYWFQIRPAKIRSECDRNVRRLLMGSSRSVDLTPDPLRLFLLEGVDNEEAPLNPRYKALYEGCLHEKGFE